MSVEAIRNMLWDNNLRRVTQMQVMPEITASGLEQKCESGGLDLPANILKEVKTMENMKKMTIIGSEKLLKQFIPLLANLERTTGEETQVEIVDLEAEKAKADKHGPKVQYSAIAGPDAVEALGSTTIKALVFAHVLKNGPCTVAEVRTAMPALTPAAVNQQLSQLKLSSLIISTPLKGA